MKVSPTSVLIGVTFFAVGIGVEVFAPHQPIGHIPPVAFNYLANGIRGLGIGFVVSAFLKRKPAKVVEGT